MDVEKGDQLLERLAAHVKEQGSELAPGWRVEVKKRNSGTSAGTSDAYYFDPAGQRFRSRQEIMRHLETVAAKANPVLRSEAAAKARSSSQATQLPLLLDNGVSVKGLGSIDVRSAYHSPTQLWPVGYHASWQDPAAGSFHCHIQDGGETGPLFTIGLVPHGSNAPPESLARASDLDSAWEELASLQQAGLDAALAAKAKPRKPKQAQQPHQPQAAIAATNGHACSSHLASDAAAPAAAAAVAVPEQTEVAPAQTAEASSLTAATPNQTAAILDQTAVVLDRTTAAPAQTAAAPAQTPAAPDHPALSSATAPAVPAQTAAAPAQIVAAPVLSGTALANGHESHPAHSKQISQHQQENQAANSQHAKDMSSEPEETDPAVLAKRQLLMKAAPLAGHWAAERFGLADIQVLKLLEALSGVEELCTGYEYVEQRQGWAAEERRLKKELDKHGKQAAKVSKGLERKGAKLSQLQANEETKLAKAEERMEAQAAAKRKRQEEKQAEKAELKKARLEQSEAEKASKQKPKAPSSAAAAGGGKLSPGRTKAGLAAKAKARSTTGMTKDEKDIQHVLNKVIGQVERKFNREQEKAAQKAEKDAAKAQKHREKGVRQQANRVKSNQAPGQQQPAAAAKPAQAPAVVDITATDVEDSLLRGATEQPPAADPVGRGLLTAQQMSGLIELREFLAWNIKDSNGESMPVPPLEDLEAAFVDPAQSARHLQVLADVHLPLLRLVVGEAFEAAIDVAGQENMDIRWTEMHAAEPPMKADSWPEVVRRYFALAATTVLVRATEASGGLDTALGALVGATPLALLGPFAILQSLTAGAHTGEPATAGAARLPLGASQTAPEAMQVKQDAISLAAAESFLLKQHQEGSSIESQHPAQDAESHKATILTCRRMLLDIASIKAPRAEAGHATTRSLAFDAHSAAAAARSGVPLDLMTVAARVDAGVYSSMAQGVDAFEADVQAVCKLFRAASQRNNSTFAAELNSKHAAAVADLVLDRMAKLMSQHSGAALPDQGPTPGKRLKKQNNAESPDTPDNDKQVNIVEDLERPFAPWEGCCVCWEDEDRKHILLCDKCDAEYHTYCLDPPLEEVPEGEWFCPRCQKELGRGDTALVHSSLHPTPFMKQEDFYRTLAAALGQQDYKKLTVQQRVQIAVLLCNFAMSSNEVRTQLVNSEESRKEMRKELVHLRAKIKREEKERAATAAADAAEAQSAGAASKDKGKDGNVKRTRSAQEADASSELQRDLARIEELTADLRRASVTSEMLGYDRHWNRYWLLQSSCPDAAAADGSPSSSSVYVERCQAPPAETRLHVPKQDPEEELPLGQLAQQAHHDSPSAQPAKHRKVHIPNDQGSAQAWGCYATVEQVKQLTAYLNARGKREGQLLKALQRVKTQLPAAASLESATAILEAAKQVPAPPKAQAVPAQLENSAIAAAAQPMPAPVQTDGNALATGNDPAAQLPAGAPADASHPAAAASRAASHESCAAAMEVDVKPADLTLPAALEPSAPQQLIAAAPGQVRGQEEDQELWQAGQEERQAVVSSLDRCRDDIRAFHSSLAAEAFESVKGSALRQGQWHMLLANAQHPQELMAALVLLEGMLRHERFKPHWRICNMPAPNPHATGSLAAVRLRLQALKGAVRLKITGAAAMAREAKEAPAYLHAGGGYSFRQRKGPGALAEPSGESDEGSQSREHSRPPPRQGPQQAAKLQANAKRKRAKAKPDEEDQMLDEDAALARQLQEQEEALARGGRSTRASLRGPSKAPSSSSRPSSGRQAGGGRPSAGLRSSSRLKPPPPQTGSARTTRAASAGMRTTRSQALEEPTYSSSSEEEEEDSSLASDASGSDDDKSADSMPEAEAALQASASSSSDKDSAEASRDESEGSGDAAQSDAESDGASAAVHTADDGNQLRENGTAARTAPHSKPLAGRKRLRKAA